MTITSGENPDSPNVIHINGQIDPESADFEGASEVFFDPRLDVDYDATTGLEEEAKEWSEHFPEVVAGAKISNSQEGRKFVNFEGDWLTLIMDREAESLGSTSAHLVADVEGRDVIVADVSELVIDPVEPDSQPGETSASSSAKRIADLLGKYSDNTEKLEAASIAVGKGLQDRDEYTVRMGGYQEDLPLAA